MEILKQVKSQNNEVCHEINYPTNFEEDPFKNPFDHLIVDIQYTGLQIQLLVRNEAYLHKNKEKVLKYFCYLLLCEAHLIRPPCIKVIELQSLCLCVFMLDGSIV